MAQHNACSSCSLGEFMAERTDAWKTALKLLQGAELDKGSEGEPPFDVEDVMNLAIFIAGIVE